MRQQRRPHHQLRLHLRRRLLRPRLPLLHLQWPQLLRRRLLWRQRPLSSLLQQPPRLLLLSLPKLPLLPLLVPLSTVSSSRTACK
jgi:hypothetical protein